MTDPQAVPDIRRYQAHAELFDKLSKLRAFLSMLHASGFEHFRAMDETRQAEYLWTCLDYAEGAYTALTVWDGMDVVNQEDLHYGAELPSTGIRIAVCLPTSKSGFKVPC